ncbi:MAG: glycosyltransferase [Candidatus Enteromonas sp.]|nr:glycosyltransferase [Candidatus Enteromonas sp.]
MDISILLPNKSQGKKLIAHLKESILPYFDASGVSYEVLICPNGCTEDEMAYFSEVLKSLPPQVRVLDNATPGKGSGVRAGILAAKGDYVLFMDADLATGLEVFETVQPLLGEKDAIVASRDVKGSKYGQKQPFVRRLTHFASRQIIAMMFHLRVKDTQCGYKCFRRSVALKMVEKQIVDGFAFDVEYLYFLRLNGYSIAEIPCVWTDDPDSTITRKGTVYKKFFQDLKRIKKNKKNYILKEEETHAH